MGTEVMRGINKYDLGPLAEEQMHIALWEKVGCLGLILCVLGLSFYLGFEFRAWFWG